MLFRWSARLPLAVLHMLGALLGWLAYLASPTYRKRFNANVAQAGIAPRQARRAIAEAGKLATELPWLWLRPRAQKLPKIQWQGVEHLEAALALGKGVVFMTPHVGSFEVVPQAHAARFSEKYGAMTILYKPSKFAWLDDLLKAARSAPGLEAAPTTTGGVRMILKSLKQGRVVGMLPDQVPGAGEGVWAPFFGKPAWTMTLAARLAAVKGVRVIYTWAERLPQGAGYVFRLQAPTEALSGVLETDIAIINREVERIILQCPQQYLWGYNRYKRPRGERAGADQGAPGEGPAQ